jgi:hypothetical protein
MMRILLILFLIPALVKAQDSTRVNESTSEENIALITMTGIIIPLALAGTVVSSLPPSVSIVSRDGREFGALTVESGFGIGQDRGTGILSDWRLGLSYTFVIHSSVRDIFRAEVKRDFHFDFIDRRRIIMPGVHVSAGFITDFPNEGYTVGAGAWVKTPWIGYFGFFPEHTYGFTYRYNKFFAGREFHQFSLGMTSAFTF